MQHIPVNIIPLHDFLNISDSLPMDAVLRNFTLHPLPILDCTTRTAVIRSRNKNIVRKLLI